VSGQFVLQCPRRLCVLNIIPGCCVSALQTCPGLLSVLCAVSPQLSAWPSPGSLCALWYPSRSGHNGIDVGALTVDPRGRYVATGELGLTPRIHIWDALTGQQINRLQYFHRKGVCVVAFSQGPKVSWKAALPSSVALVEKEGAGATTGPGLGTAKVKAPGVAAAPPKATSGGAGGDEGDESAALSLALDDEVLIGKGGLVGAGNADGCRFTDGAGWDEGGYRLVSVGLDGDHTIAVWHSRDGTWADAKLVAHAPSSKEKVLFACFVGSTNNKPCDIVTGGVKHVTFWQVCGRILVPYNGVFGKKGRVRDLACHPFLFLFSEFPFTA
jgi:hypothetical protein